MSDLAALIARALPSTTTMPKLASGANWLIGGTKTVTSLKFEPQ